MFRYNQTAASEMNRKERQAVGSVLKLGRLWPSFLNITYWLLVDCAADMFMAFNAGFKVANIPNTYKQNTVIKM